MQLNLNQQQKEFVESPLGNSLVLAGAGTGKTRVLIERIVYLLATEQMNASNIMAITFSRKAATEIKERLKRRFLELTPENGDAFVRQITTGTFHSVFAMFLRIFVDYHPYLKAGFTIIDPSNAQNRLYNFVVQDKSDVLLKKLFGVNGTTTKGIKSNLFDFFSSCKENLIKLEDFTYDNFLWILNRIFHADDIENNSKWTKRVDEEELKLAYKALHKSYQFYQDELRALNLVDYSDLLLEPYLILKHNPTILKRITDRYKYIMVDECQDMNLIQYKIVELLSSATGTFTALIGDDDQSIYGFRGADVTLINHYQSDFNHVVTYKLEDNYRCSPNIIEASNKIINLEKTSNVKVLRAAKSFTSDNKVGVHFHKDFETSFDPFVNLINKQASESGYGSILVVARTSTLLDDIERLFNTKMVPYVKISGIKFYQRAEIKLAMSYLQVVLNPNNNQAFESAVQKPSRLVGPKMIQKLIEVINNSPLEEIVSPVTGLPAKFAPKVSSYYQAVKELEAQGKLNNKSSQALRYFIQQIDDLRKDSLFLPLGKLLEKILRTFEIYELFEKEDEENRGDNLRALVNICDNFVLDDLNAQQDREQEIKLLTQQYPDATPSEIETLYSHNQFIVLNQLETSFQESPDYIHDQVTLSTIHGVKGLEFEHVHIIAVDHETMPSRMSISKAELEEERRLMYVAMTRAKESLDLHFYFSRVAFGRWIDVRPSQYISELLNIHTLTNLDVYVKNQLLDPKIVQSYITVQEHDKLFHWIKKASHFYHPHEIPSCQSKSDGDSSEKYRQEKTSRTSFVNKFTSNLKSSFSAKDFEEFINRVKARDLNFTNKESSNSSSEVEHSMFARTSGKLWDDGSHGYERQRAHTGKELNTNHAYEDLNNCSEDCFDNLELDKEQILARALSNPNSLESRLVQRIKEWQVPDAFRDETQLKQGLMSVVNNMSKQDKQHAIMALIANSKSLDDQTRKAALFNRLWIICQVLKFSKLEGFKEWLILAIDANLLTKFADLFSPKAIVLGEVIAGKLGYENLINYIYKYIDISRYSSAKIQSVLTVLTYSCDLTAASVVFKLLTWADNNWATLLERILKDKISIDRIMSSTKWQNSEVKIKDESQELVQNVVDNILTTPEFIRLLKDLSDQQLVATNVNWEDYRSLLKKVKVKNYNCLMQVEGLTNDLLTKCITRVAIIRKNSKLGSSSENNWNKKMGIVGVYGYVPDFKIKSNKPAVPKLPIN